MALRFVNNLRMRKFGKVMWLNLLMWRYDLKFLIWSFFFFFYELSYSSIISSVARMHNLYIFFIMKEKTCNHFILFYQFSKYCKQMHKGFLCRVDDIESSNFFSLFIFEFISSINIVHYACWYKCHRIIKSSLTIFILYKSSVI